jgi:hypothetical protein
MHTGLFEVATTVGQLLGEHEVMDVLPLFAEQVLGIDDQGIELRFALLRSLRVGTLGAGSPGVPARTSLAVRRYRSPCAVNS